MAALIEGLGPNRPPEGLQTLRGIVNEAVIVIKTAQAPEARRTSGQDK